MIFEFDDKKNRQNKEDHGIDFEEARKLWGGSHVVIPAKNVTGENRYAILGKIRERVYMAIYAERGGVTRIISCHRADRKWERVFYEYLKKSEKE